MNQVQRGTAIGTGAYNVAGVGWDFRLIQDNMKHLIDSSVQVQACVLILKLMG